MFPLIFGAIDFGQIFGIVILVVSVLSWIVNVIQGNTPDGNPRSKKAKPKAKSEKSEIEILLHELTSEKKKPKPDQRQQSPPPPKPSQASRPVKQKVVSQRPGGPPPYELSRPAPRPTESKLAPSNLGATVRSHHLGNRVEAAVEQDVTAVVQHDLGNRISAATPSVERSVHPLVRVLRDPQGVRQAILLNEILQRPKALRR